MTQNNPEETPAFTQEQVSSADFAEKQSLTNFTLQYLNKRVVVLRVTCDLYKAEVDALKAELARLRELLYEDVKDDQPE